MIVAETASGYRFVTQPDHAALAGRFADHWGTERFALPEPSPAVAIAAYTHDDGWWDRDRRPRLGDDGNPEDFTDVPPEPWIALYDEGVDAAVELDRYAGLLVSMHGVGLRKQRYGLSPSWPSTPDAFTDFVQRQEERQRTLAGQLREEENGPIEQRDVEVLATLQESGSAPAEPDSRLWRNYELLQAWDALSLSFCTTVTPPSYDDIGPIPTGESGGEVTLSVELLDDGSFAMEPYPFDTDPLVASVPTRTVPKSSFDDEADLVRGYFENSLEREEFTLRPVDR